MAQEHHGLEPATMVNILRVEEDYPSSSPPSSSLENRTSNTKIKKPPPITPNSFRRFFTPRTSLPKGRKRASRSRRALEDITLPASNRRSLNHGQSLDPFPDIKKTNNGSVESALNSRKRSSSQLPSPDESPARSSPCKRARTSPAAEGFTVFDETEELLGQIIEDDSEDSNEEHESPPQSVRRCQESFLPTQILHESIGGRCGPQAWRSSEICPDWQNETKNFYTLPEDLHTCSSTLYPHPALPFCSASCNTNSLVAVGDEEGGVRFLETSKSGKVEFRKNFLSFRPHANALLDLCFSSDDFRIATASGDQTALVTDVQTQRHIANLIGHGASVKQIRFQPGTTDVVATASRDGSVKIWDLRCKGGQASVQSIKVGLDGSKTETASTERSHVPLFLRPINDISRAHMDRKPGTTPLTNSLADTPSRWEAPGRRSDVSVTTLSFLNPGREHLLLTGSESNACLNLWDLRTTYTRRRGGVTPISTTKQPESHNTHRVFGTNSLAISGDGHRIYSLCRDNSIYAYSTNHLILGHAPELSSTVTKPRWPGRGGRDGLGPIYGFRHPKLHPTTFYVKLALRPAKNDHTELLAVGSSDGCAVLFPTDERYLRKPYQSVAAREDVQITPRIETVAKFPRPSLSRSSSGIGALPKLNDTIPIYTHGTALTRGHQREVSDVSWSSEGELVTVGDDFIARCWREGPEARDLRKGGEQEGRRWGCGWAEADDEDEEYE